jgi:Mlc titration factor MtfA (ptsG expression regulator)
MWRWPDLWRPVARRQTIPDGLWSQALAQLPYCQALDQHAQARLRKLTAMFLRTKTFEGAAGLIPTDTMRVRIAVQACVLILNLDFDSYAGWHAVILYPGDFRVHKEEVDASGVVHRWQEDLSGEAWEQGPVILSWDTAAAPTDGRTNIVLHEFAHKLDMRNGRADGLPLLPAELSADDWTRDFQAAYRTFCDRLDRGQPVRIDDYAAESPAEFFAVLSEAFFLNPKVVRTDFPGVYRQLAGFYRQDPLTVLPDEGEKGDVA